MSKNETMTDKVCEICCIKFQISLCLSNRGNGRYCSRKCHHKSKVVPLRDRFEKYKGIPNENNCMNWLAGKDKDGYGKIKKRGSGGQGDLRAHRVAWELANGPIPEGMKVLHKCDNTSCVNIDHLFLGTTDDNNK